MRGDLFVYRAADDPWIERMKAAPEQALRQMMPGLGRLIGDSFATACPASGAGLDKVLSDVARLAVHLPEWLATPGMGAEKIARFYADTQKRAADTASLARSRSLREMSIASGLRWRPRRGLGFLAQTARGGLSEVLPLETRQVLTVAQRREA